MKKKIAYLTLTAVIGVTAFFVGKNFTAQPTQPETVQTETIQTMSEILHLTVTEYGLQIDFTDNTGIWIETEDLEKAGLINPANITDWNTDGGELAVMTENGYEWYAYQSENVYQNRAFVPVEK